MSDKGHLDEELLGLRMVKDRVLSEAQLSTARDFQKAVGGALNDVILRLRLVEAPALESYLQSIGVDSSGVSQSVNSPKERRSGKASARDERRTDKTVAIAAKDEAAAKKGLSDFAETAIVLEALIRLLVKKGVISKADLKNEVLQMNTDDLVRNGVLVGGE